MLTTPYRGSTSESLFFGFPFGAMPGSESARSDHAIPAISTRSFLDLDELQSEVTTHPSVSEKPAGQGNSGPRLRPRSKRAFPMRSELSEKTEIEKRPRGRPRLEASKDAAAIEAYSP